MMACFPCIESLIAIISNGAVNNNHQYQLALADNATIITAMFMETKHINASCLNYNVLLYRIIDYILTIKMPATIGA